MAFLAKFDLDGKEYDVHTCHYELHQQIDANGKPSSRTRGGTIHIQIESTSSTSLFEWMCDNHQRKNGSIRFIKDTDMATLKQLDFTDGYLVNYGENFDFADSSPMIQSLVISSREIKMGNGEHVNEWPED
ncbi:MAG: type VI secretion system tube protein TssD [Bacteroidota bacterium]|nr:type VI secretion system tube protein TssD [Bacteroidota bacterium]